MEYGLEGGMSEGKELRLERGKQKLQNSRAKAMTMGVEIPTIGKPEGKFLVTPDTQGGDGWGGGSHLEPGEDRDRHLVGAGFETY